MTDSEKLTEQARARIDELIAFFRKTHHLPMLIELHALAAIAAEKQKLPDIADEHCSQALRIGSQGRFIGLFRSVGSALLPLLKRQTGQEINPAYLEKISSTLTPPDRLKSVGAPGSMPDAQIVQQTTKGSKWRPLSNRELEILSLLRQRLSNKEIASELYISINTVKRHIINIYQKLEVHNRREAVAKAEEIDLAGLS